MAGRVLEIQSPRCQFSLLCSRNCSFGGPVGPLVLELDARQQGQVVDSLFFSGGLKEMKYR